MRKLSYERISISLSTIVVGIAASKMSLTNFRVKLQYVSNTD